MSINTILFDLDGTLIDTAPDLAYALNVLLAEHNISEKPYAQIKPLVAFGANSLIKLGFGIDESSPDFYQKQQQFLSIYTENINKNSVLFSGFEAVFERIKNARLHWGIVTNKPQNLTHLLLKQLNLKPAVVVCGDTLKYHKPHPAPLLYACAKLAVLPSQCLFVGDDESDIIAGYDAGIKTIAVNWGYGKPNDDWNYDYLVQQPSQLLQFIHKEDLCK